MPRNFVEFTRISAVVVVILASQGVNSHAALNTYEFTGTLMTASGGGAVGESVNGIFTYDTAAPNVGALPNIGEYAQGVTLSMTFGGKQLGTPSAHVANDNGGVVDLLTLRGNRTVHEALGQNGPLDVELRLSAATTLFSDDSLPSTIDFADFAADPSGFTDSIRFSLNGSPGFLGQMSADIVGITPLGSDGTIHTFGYSAVVDAATGVLPSYVPTSLGHSFSGTFSYDTSAPDTNPLVNFGDYEQNVEFSTDIVATLTAASPTVTVNNNNGGVVDLFIADGDTINGTSFGIQLSAATSLFTDTSLPSSLDLADYAADPFGFDDQVFFNGGGMFDPVFGSGPVQSLTLVPEPSACLLAAIAVLARPARRSRRSKLLPVKSC